MFGVREFEAVRETASAAAAVEPGCLSPDERAAALKAVRATQDILEGAEAALLSAFDIEQDYAVHGAATTASWVRRELRMTGEEARAHVKAGRTLRDLPQVAEAAHHGQIRAAHVRCFTSGLTKTGLPVMVASQDWLLEVARTCDPAELRATIDMLAQVAFPEDLDRAWARGMDKQDLKLAKVGDGYHLTGFLDILTGAQFASWLQARSAPRDAGDDRPASQRRVEALSDLLTSALEHGLPTDKGVRPQLNVTCDLETLLAQLDRPQTVENETGTNRTAEGEPTVSPVPLPAAPAELAGFGPIGADLLSYLGCTADLTALLVGGDTTGPTPQADILNVGRIRRLGTARQRRAILVRQEGECANPGCRHTNLEVHHIRWWSHDGPTDLDNLVGVCKRCHILIHHEKLTVTADGARGVRFHHHSGKTIPDNRRLTNRAVRQRLHQLTRQPDPGPPRTQPPPQPASIQPTKQPPLKPITPPTRC